MGEVLLLVALKTDQPNIERRLKTILAASEPFAPDTEPHAWAKPVNELVAADFDALSVLLGWDAVSRLRVGGVAGGVSNSLAESGPPATTPALPADAPDSDRVARCPDGYWSKYGGRRCIAPGGHYGPHIYAAEATCEPGCVCVEEKP